MTQEYRIFGPPGTGKTTFLKKQIEHAAEKHGSDNVIVASYTKAAAEEINSRDLPIPDENVGTLHALCYRAMGRPPLAETKENIEHFNQEYPVYKITGRNADMNGMAVDTQFATDGDRFLAEYNVLRARCLPVKGLSAELLLFIKAWEKWKLINDLIDYTDMINYTLQGNNPPPGNAKIGIYDEVQDFNRLQLNLIRHWAKYQEYIILAGDDDQSIYEWTGASPDAFLYPKIGEEFKRVLKQSWRLPRIIQDYSGKWISRVKLREEKHFFARNAEGEIKRCNADYNNPEMALEMADRYVSEGKTVMLLASCRYMIDPIRRELRRFGIPFHNPYQKDRNEWNPLGTFIRSKDGKSTRGCVISFLSRDEESEKPYWTMPDLANWASIVKVSDVFKRGAKTRIDQVMEESDGVLDTSMEQFCHEIFREDALQKALDRNITWFETSLLASKKNAAEYPIRVFEKQGLKALSDKPKIIISTIHGVKGGEADVVILFPDLSYKAMQQYDSLERDQTIRTFYVGMTRARESLVLCRPQSGFTVEL